MGWMGTMGWFYPTRVKKHSHTYRVETPHLPNLPHSKGCPGFLRAFLTSHQPPRMTRPVQIGDRVRDNDPR